MKYLILILLLLASCIKEERRDWVCWQYVKFYPQAKCKCEPIAYDTIKWSNGDTKDKTNEEIEVYRTQWAGSWWYPTNGGKDSVWMVTDCNCDPLLCP